MLIEAMIGRKLKSVVPKNVQANSLPNAPLIVAENIMRLLELEKLKNVVAIRLHPVMY